jgi:hypothetical protein
MKMVNMSMQSVIPERQALALYEILLTKEGLFDADNNNTVLSISKPWRSDVNYNQLPSQP